MKGQAPSKSFSHDGTEYIVTGNEGLADFHFHEVRAFLHATKRANVNKLPIIRASKEFDDGTVANLSLVHGREIINIFAPMHVVAGAVVEKVKLLETENIVPCFIATGGEGDRRKIVGYIACTNGTFLGPYKWFSMIGDDEILLDSFYDEGDKYYNSEIALEHMGLLSTDNDDEELLFFRQSGLSPDEDRESEGPITQAGGLVQECTGFEFVTDTDDTWAWSFAMADVVRGGESEYSWNMQFDGSAVFVNHFERNIFGGSDYASVDERICSASDGPCIDDAQEWMDGFTLEGSCSYTDNDVNSFDRTEDIRLENGEFINGSARLSLRLNSALDSSVFIHFSTIQNTSLHTWVERDTPVYPGFWGIIQDEGEPDDVEFGSETSITFTTYAYVTVDGIESNISNIFGWGAANKYDGRGELDILYHKGAEESEPTVLATMLSGPDDGSFTGMGLIYVGPNANEFLGSRKCPLQNIGGDYYIDLGDVIDAPNDIEWRVRGHVFLGLITSEIEYK